ncbi:Rdx family protein [Candidatus Eisenbacteria bacterium]|uniref:Rdx family protein n=1 Tax=Eiseniibacteriota bacterium TaxID=2212470 RepID=A0ABV6YNX5_UNCEI
MAAAIEERFGKAPELIEGEHGVFDLTVDGRVVFSRKKAGSFISTPDLVELVAAHLEASGRG